MKQLNRKTLIIVGSVVGALVLIGALLSVLYIAVWKQPSKQDFTTAYTQAKEISDYGASKQLSDLVTKVNEQVRAGVMQPKLGESVTAEKKKVDDLIGKRTALNEKLKASIVLRDEQVKKSYDTYAAQETKYATYMKGYAATYPSYRSSLATCLKPFQINDAAGTNVTKYAALHRTAAVECYKDLDVVMKSKVAPLAEYGKEFKRILTERQKVFDGLEKKTLDNDKAGDRIKELGDQFTKISPADKLQEAVKDASFNGELNDLIKLLDDKAKAAK